MDTTLMTPGAAPSTPVGIVPPMTNNFGRDKVHWTPDIWDRIDKAVHDEVMRTLTSFAITTNNCRTITFVRRHSEHQFPKSFIQRPTSPRRAVNGSIATLPARVKGRSS